MTDKKTEAMKLALEALEHMLEDAKQERLTVEYWNECVDAITALREALAKPDFWEGYVPEPDSTCNNTLRAQGKGYPRTCKKCGLGPCVGLAQQALDKKAENARELGLDYEPAQQEPVTPCTHPSLGFSSLREDGAASRWSCVMCGTEFVPKTTQRWTEFNEATKRNIEHAEWYLSTHPQPAQQEPAGWRPATFHRDNLTFNPGLPDEQTVKFWKLQGVEIEYCYTSPPAQRKPLTDEQIADLYFDKFSMGELKAFARAIEAAHGIKENT